LSSIDDLFSDLKEDGKKEEKPTLPKGSPEQPPGEIPVPTEPAPEIVVDSVSASAEEPLGQVDPAPESPQAGSPVIPEVPIVQPPTEEKPASASDLFGEPETPTEPKLEETDTPPVSEPLSATDLFAPAPTVEPSAVVEPPKPVLNVVTPEPVKEDGLFSGGSVVLAPVESLPHPELPGMPAQFDLSSDTGGHGKVFMIYGEKGESKTTLALSFPGKIYAISFDRKTVEVWLSMYGADKRIDVKDALRYMSWSSPEARLKSSDISLRYIDALIEESKKFQPDWILIDATDGYTKMAEMTMRYRNNIGMTEGVSWTYWTERRLYIKQLHLKALGIAKRGIIYTAFVGVREKIEDNKIVETMDQPKWVDVVKDETDVAIRVKAKLTDDGMKYTAIIDSSKWRPIKTGIRVDITVPEGENPNCFDRIIEASRSKKI